MSQRRELTVDKAEDAHSSAVQWIRQGWHRDAHIFEKRSGPGEDLYGRYIGRWTAKAGRQWVEVTVRLSVRGTRLAAEGATS